MKKELKVGDKIFFRKGSFLSGFETILKITKTTAKTKNYTLALKTHDKGNLHIKGQDVWNTTTASLSNEKLEKEWEETKILNWYYKNKDKFTDNQIKKIYQLLTN